MILRQVRWLAASLAAVAALCLAPASSQAGTQILVQEIDGGGNVIAGTTQIFASSTNITATLSNFSKVSIIANPNSGTVSSLTTTVNATPISSGFNSNIGLRVIVTSDGFLTPMANVGGNAVVTNNAGASSAISGGQNMLTNITQLLNTPLTTPTSDAANVAAGTNLGAATAKATDVRDINSTAPASPPTRSTVTDLPGTFAIQQMIDVRAINVGAGGIDSGSTLGGSASSLVVTAPVPAPGGLALALIGLPLIGLRRVFRKKAAV